MSKIKEIIYNGNKYLVAKFFLFEYLIIDLTTKKSLTKEEVGVKFDEKFFVNNFSEKAVGNDFDWLLMYDFWIYIGDVQFLFDFYYENRMIFEAPTNIFL